MASRSGAIVTKGALTTVWQGTPATWRGWPSTSLSSSTYQATYAAMYRDQLWVNVAVRKRALLTARLPLKVYLRDDLNRPEARDHPYAKLLRHPNPKHSQFFFWQWVSSTFDIYGESFVGKIRDSAGRPIMLVPLHPTGMNEEYTDSTGRTFWTFQNGRIRIEDIPDEDLFHPKSFNPDTLTRGLSPLESLRRTLENEDYAQRATSAFWRNGARPGVALTHPGKLSQAAADRLKVSWDNIAGGADNTGKTVVLEEGMKPEVMSLTAEEAQYIESRKLNREEVVAAFDMPPPAVHILDHATFSNITEQLRSVYRDTMATHLGGFEAELETQVRASVRPGGTEPDFGDEVYAEFLLDEVLRGDFESQADAWQKKIFSGQATPAEARRAMNMPFIEGSDRLFINSTMVPLQTAGAPKPLPELPAPALPADTVRTVMGRLSRQKTLADIDIDSVVEGLNGSGVVVRSAYDAAVSAHESIVELRNRIKNLEVIA